MKLSTAILAVSGGKPAFATQRCSGVELKNWMECLSERFHEQLRKPRRLGRWVGPRSFTTAKSETRRYYSPKNSWPYWENQMTTADDNKQLLQQLFAELATGNSRPFVDHLADDVSWRVMGQTAWSKTYRGKQSVLTDLLGVLRERLADRYRATAERVIAEGDFVVVQARGAATTRAGVPYNNDYCFVYRLADGMIKEVSEYLDTELVTSALGGNSEVSPHQNRER